METVIVTYKELAERLNIKPQSARKLAQRKKWMRSAGNDGTARVHVPLDALTTTSDSPRDSHGDISYQVYDLRKQVAVLETELKHATEKIGTLETQCADLKNDRDAWRGQAQKLSEKKRGWFW